MTRKLLRLYILKLLMNIITIFKVETLFFSHHFHSKICAKCFIKSEHVLLKSIQFSFGQYKLILKYWDIFSK